MMAIALLVLILTLDSVRRLRLATLCESRTFDLRALDDKLRDYVASGKIDSSNWAYEHVAKSIRRNSENLLSFNLWQLALAVHSTRNDEVFEKSFVAFQSEIFQPKNIYLKEIYSDHASIVLRFIGERHFVLGILARAFFTFFVGAHFFYRVIENPEMSTFDEHCPQN